MHAFATDGRRLRPATQPMLTGLLACLAGMATAATTPVPAAAQIEIQSFRRQAPRAWLGFSYDPGSGPGTVTVVSVSDGSPARKAGMQEGDVVRRVNGLAATAQLVASLSGSLEPGDTVRLRVTRDGRARDLSVVAAAPPDWVGRDSGVTLRALNGDSIVSLMHVFLDSARSDMELPRRSWFSFRTDDSSRVWAGSPGAQAWSLEADSLRVLPRGFYQMQIETGMRAVAGAEFTQVNPELGAYFGVDSGLLVTRVAPDSPAARGGLEAGDVVVRAAGRTMRDVADLRYEVRRAQGNALSLDVVRQKKTRTLTVKLE